MRLREVRFEDYDGVAAVLVRNGLRTPSRDQWAYLWRANPHRDRLARLPLGWVLDYDADGLVGAFRNIAFLYEWNSRPVRVAVASAWAVDAAHRHQSLRLAVEYFKQPGVDVLLNTTAVAETSGKAFLKFRADRVPQPTYTTRLLWITGYAGFAADLIRARRIPGAPVLRYPAAFGLRLADAFRGGAGRRLRDDVRSVDAFDARFDQLWTLLRQQPNRLQAIRDCATLRWRFALEREQPTIVVMERAAALAGYIVLVRRDQDALRRLEVADLQAIGDDAETICSLLDGALRAAADQGIHPVAMSGVGGAKRQALSALKPHAKATPGWPLYYKAIDATLEEPLRSPDAWDLSLYDGDALWSGRLRAAMTIDHVGIVVASLEASAAYYIQHFGLRPVGASIVDPLQDVELRFLEDDRGARLELIRPLSADSPVARALRHGGGLNHICYRVADLDASVSALVASDAKLVREPQPAVAFNGRRVAFLYTRQRELVEFVEAERG